ncbi:MAG TPA: L-histidine N(alpha)-methyltransferase [Pyrinomonadaceae bacterium]|jgi:dimethylhistidine N-methyltransferase|nr:L-histidine N(alpha)-methyltransferase [Pyrinomonadaceae bacterium]
MTHRAPDTSSDGRLIVHNLVGAQDLRATFAADVRAGLSARPLRLFPKYFYDDLGSKLFEAICLLPEYYLTRAENEIFSLYAEEIVAATSGEPGTLLEMGSGSASKTRRLVEALLKRQRELLYIPVDISLAALETSSRALLQAYAELRIEAYASDYYDGLAALGTPKQRQQQQEGHTLALFLGSNIGNFDHEEARRFLRALRGVLGAGDALLLGADLRKEPSVLEAAYDDALGLTAAFNLNLLSRINRELGADFNLRAFRHRALYNEEIGRVELYLESTRAQTVRLNGLEMEVEFAGGERIHTENSYKYDLEGLSQLAAATGFERARTWLDDGERFSSNLFMAVAET